MAVRLREPRWPGEGFSFWSERAVRSLLGPFPDLRFADRHGPNSREGGLVIGTKVSPSHHGAQLASSLSAETPLLRSKLSFFYLQIFTERVQPAEF